MRTPLLVALLALASPARASRALDEPGGLAKAARQAPRAVVDEALAEAGLADACRDALTAPGLLGLQCRAVVASHAVRKKPLESAADVDARNALFVDLD